MSIRSTSPSIVSPSRIFSEDVSLTSTDVSRAGVVWAEVLDADAFAAFQENGLFDRETATSFRKNILERGGTADAMDLWKAFRGREPYVEPLLKRRGLK